MIATSEALVLRFSPFSRTSHVVTWLTPQAGKVVTVVKGALRPRSVFLGQYDLFYTCELSYYIREHNGLHNIKECCPLDTRSQLRSNWRSAAAASYISDLLLRVSTSGDYEHELYELAGSCLDHICLHGATRPFLLWFELVLLTALGFAPNFHYCLSCNRNMPVSARPVFSPVRGGLVCRSCSATSGPDVAQVLQPDILAILRRWQQANHPRIAHTTRCTSEQLFALQSLLGVFLLAHVDVSKQSRHITMEMLTFPGADEWGES